MKRSTPATRIVAIIAERNDAGGLRKGAGATPGRRVLRRARGARGGVAGRTRLGGARLPGPRARRRRLVPGRTGPPDRLRAAAREGRAPPRALRARPPRAG